MSLPAAFRLSVEDSAILGVPAFEIEEPSLEDLQMASRIPGHYTVRVDPRFGKSELHNTGFYYCDTLIEPYCSIERLKNFEDDAVDISRDISLEPLLQICHDAFSHGRFHRDFNVAPSLADLRYVRWLVQLHAARQVYGLLHSGNVVGFIAADRGHLALHAVATTIRGRGLAKYLWSPVCNEIFRQGHREITSSVSATNLAAINLYAALAFRFRKPVDVYHRLTA